MLLSAELLVALMFSFSPDVSHAGLLVFVDIEDFAVHFGALDSVIRHRGVDRLLFCRFRSTDLEAGGGKQRFGVVGLELGAAG